METITTQTFLPIVVGLLLLIGLIRFLAQKTQKDYLYEHYDSDYDPEKELGIGAFQKPIEHKNQNLIVLKHLENGLIADDKFATTRYKKVVCCCVNIEKKRS